MSAVLDVDVEQRLGDFTLAVSFTSFTRSTALYGHSGAGKTSLAHLIAGLSRPRRGRIAVEGHILLDTARGISVPAHQRRVGYVFQEARLFPHFSVRRNLEFGGWFNGRADARTSARVVDLLGLGPLLGRATHKLSGGERQRVALGRALLSSPRLLLMDEPLASLDTARKEEILPYIESVRDEAGVPVVYVSHALAEIARIASTVVRIEAGRVTACGPAEAVLAGATDADEPVTLWEGFVEVSAEGGGLVRGAFGTIALPGPGLPLAGAAVTLRVPARSVLVADGALPPLSAAAVLPAVVSAVQDRGPACDVTLRCAQATLTARVPARSMAALALAPGRSVSAVLTDVSLEPAGSRFATSGSAAP